MLGSPLEIGIGWFIMVFLTWFVIFGGVGMFLSRTREQSPVAGFLLGSFLGVIGWLLVFPIAAAAKTARKRAAVRARPPLRVERPALPPPRPVEQPETDLGLLPPPPMLNEMPPPMPDSLSVPAERDIDAEIQLKRRPDPEEPGQ